MASLAYAQIRSLVERRGGTMIYEHAGHRHGAWLIAIGGRSLAVEATGERSFPQLDRLYVPRVPEPQTWDDYEDELVPGAEARLLGLLCTAELSGGQVEELEQIVAHTHWKFAWTYARTYPHEYTTRQLCDPADHARLIDCIERYGLVESFGTAYRKYFYFGERKYWHMGDPSSPDPEQWPNVINRAWVDVRRHAENVKHRWTPEEVELQQRLWEIQLEKAAGKGKAGPK